MLGFDPSLYAVSLIVTLMFSVIRLAGHKGNVFKAIAHCWVGFLFGVSFGSHDRAYWVQAWFISGVELFAFIITRVWPKIRDRGKRF